MQAQAPSSQSDVALEAVRLMTQQLERQNKQQKTNKDSDSEDEEVKDYKCSKSLEKYGLSGFPNDHLAPQTIMEKTCRKG